MSGISPALPISVNASFSMGTTASYSAPMSTLSPWYTCTSVTRPRTTAPTCRRKRLGNTSLRARITARRKRKRRGAWKPHLQLRQRRPALPRVVRNHERVLLQILRNVLEVLLLICGRIRAGVASEQTASLLSQAQTQSARPLWLPRPILPLTRFARVKPELHLLKADTLVENGVLEGPAQGWAPRAVPGAPLWRQEQRLNEYGMEKSNLTLTRAHLETLRSKGPLNLDILGNLVTVVPSSTWSSGAPSGHTSSRVFVMRRRTQRLGAPGNPSRVRRGRAAAWAHRHAGRAEAAVLMNEARVLQPKACVRPPPQGSVRAHVADGN